MGQQIRKVTKRRRRAEYIKRKKEQAKLNTSSSIRLAVPVAKEVKPAAKEAPAKKTAAKAPAKKAEAKKTEPRLPSRRPLPRSLPPRRPLSLLWSLPPNLPLNN